MDRFIVKPNALLIAFGTNLKSNMDRFIADSAAHICKVDVLFKIQYG